MNIREANLLNMTTATTSNQTETFEDENFIEFMRKLVKDFLAIVNILFSLLSIFIN